MTIEAKVFTRRESANYLGVSLSTFDRAVKDGIIPPGIRVGRRKLIWSVRVIEDFIANGGWQGGSGAVANFREVGVSEEVAFGEEE